MGRPFTVAITIDSTVVGAAGILYVDTVTEGYSTISPLLGSSVATSSLPARVMAEPPAVIVWPLISSVEAPGSAEITLPLARVAMAVWTGVGFGVETAMTEATDGGLDWLGVPDLLPEIMPALRLMFESLLPVTSMMGVVAGSVG